MAAPEASGVTTAEKFLLAKSQGTGDKHKKPDTAVRSAATREYSDGCQAGSVSYRR